VTEHLAVLDAVEEAHESLTLSILLNQSSCR